MTYVMSDIHGHRRRFDSIMTQIDLHPEDTLYILGDVIDRNPDGIRILRQLMAMPNVNMLLGNHEYMMLWALHYPIDPDDYYANSREYNLSLWYQNGGAITHNHLKHIRKSLRQEIFQYLESLPINLNITVNGHSYLLTHAAPLDLYGQYHDLIYRYDDATQCAVWYRYQRCDKGPKDCTVIFGHTGTFDYQISNPTTIWHGNNLIGIDCGSAYEGHWGLPQTRLACLRLDDMKEFYSEETISNET